MYFLHLVCSLLVHCDLDSSESVDGGGDRRGGEERGGEGKVTKEGGKTIHNHEYTLYDLHVHVYETHICI